MSKGEALRQSISLYMQSFAICSHMVCVKIFSSSIFFRKNLNKVNGKNKVVGKLDLSSVGRCEKNYANSTTNDACRVLKQNGANGYPRLFLG